METWIRSLRASLYSPWSSSWCSRHPAHGSHALASSGAAAAGLAAALLLAATVLAAMPDAAASAAAPAPAPAGQPATVAAFQPTAAVSQATAAAPDPTAAAPKPTPAAEAIPAYTPDATVERAKIPSLYTWDLAPLFASDQASDQAMTALSGELKQLAEFKGKLADPAALARCMELYFSLHDRINRATLYANLQTSTALSNDALQSLQHRSLALMDELMGQATFLRSELLALSDAQMAAAYGAQPGLAKHKPYLDNLRRRKSRALSADAERVLVLAGDNLWAEIDLNEIPSGYEDAFTAMLTDIQWPKVHDDQGKEIQLTQANYGAFRLSKNRAVRKEAVEAFLATLRQYQHALAATLAGQLELDVTYARSRGYDTALAAYMDKDAVPTAVHDNLIATVNANLEPLHRYMELRKRVLGVSELRLYDLYTPLVPQVDLKIPFEQARTTIEGALAPLGKSYIDVLQTGLDPHNGWLDLYPSKDKRSGAFSSSVYGSHPYVLINYQDSLDDMFTLAHEYGHALHSHLAMTHQPYSSFRYVPFLAEIASTCNEALLADALITAAKDKAQKAYLLTKRAESIRTTIYRQTLFSEFERKAHEMVETGKSVNATALEQLYTDLIHRYYGPAYTLGENDGMEWAYIPHFYYKYYVYTYATGLASGISIAYRMKAEGPKAVDGYLQMLSGGCSRPPLELLKLAGVDLTQPAPIEAALKRFADTVKELEALLGT
jgi:oligoendopeptidase F